jgi:BirA family biotin operon repressor/biotin-[acetyl-CoA-carboxylase] ligase
MSLGRPRVHHRRTGSTNDEARTLALGGAPHGALVTASEQIAGRGRDGRRWAAPPGSALLCSLVLRDPPELLSLRAGVAVAEALDERARLKWPNDVLIDGRKVAGILVEARPRERWAVLGIGVNVAVELAQLPSELHASAGTLGLGRSAIEPLLGAVLSALERRLGDRVEPDSGAAPLTLTGPTSWDVRFATGSPTRADAALGEVAQQLARERRRLARHPRARAAQDLLGLGRVRERGGEQRRGEAAVLLAGGVDQPARVARVRGAGGVDEQAEQPLGLRPALHRVLLVDLARVLGHPPDPGVGLVAAADPLVDHRLQHDLRALAALLARSRCR